MRHGDVLVNRTEQPAPHRRAPPRASRPTPWRRPFCAAAPRDRSALSATRVCSRSGHAAAERQRLFEQRLRLVVDLEPLIDAADRRQHLGVHLGLDRRAPSAALPAPASSSSRSVGSGLSRIRIGAGQQLGHAARSSWPPSRASMPGAIAFGGQAHGVEADSSRDEREDTAADHDGAAMPAHELGGAIARRVSGRALIGCCAR